MLRASVVTLVLAGAVAAGPSAAGVQQTGARATGSRVTTVAKCTADLGTGVKSRRRFCDVIVPVTAGQSVVMTIPAHRGGATLRFDLHNRFTIPPAGTAAAQAFTRHAAVVAVVRPNGTEIERAAVSSEYRTVEHLFDRIAGTGPGGVKAVAPGRVEAVRIAIPAGVSAIGIVGIRLETIGRGGREVFDSPGRPVAIVSNLRIEYTP